MLALISHAALALSVSTSKTVSRKPPVARTHGTVPYRMAVIWVKPHGSNIDGTTMTSQPAYINRESVSSNAKKNPASSPPSCAPKPLKSAWTFGSGAEPSKTN